MKQRGFTFIEILVVITIIAILVVIGIVSYGSVNQRSRDARRKSDIEQIRSALEMYRADNGYYPDGGPTVNFDAVGLAGSAIETALSEYLSPIPVDPKDNDSYPYEILMTDGRPVGAVAHYYGYCLAGFMESVGSVSTTCTDTLPTSDSTGKQYNYGVKNP